MDAADRLKLEFFGNIDEDFAVLDAVVGVINHNRRLFRISFQMRPQDIRRFLRVFEGIVVYSEVLF